MTSGVIVYDDDEPFANDVEERIWGWRTGAYDRVRFHTDVTQAEVYAVACTPEQVFSLDGTGYAGTRFVLIEGWRQSGDLTVKVSRMETRDKLDAAMASYRARVKVTGRDA